MPILHDHAPGSKRPWDHDPGNEPAENNDKAKKVRSNVPSLEHGMDEIKEVLQNGLDGIATPADRDWAFSGLLPNAVNPGLTLPKSGTVGLPLSPSDVARIQDEARRSIGDVEDLNDEKSPCWTLSAEHFGLQNPSWATFVKDFVWETFGSSAGLYQIDLVGLRVEGASGSSSAKLSGFAEFLYSDVQHSSLPMQSGHRLQLEYRIHNPGYQQIETASSLAEYAEDFEGVLKEWKILWKADSAPPLLAYILEDEDPPPEIPKFLKPGRANELKSQYLQERGAKQGVCAYFASLRSTINGNASDNAQLVLEHWSNLGGGQMPGVSVDVTLAQIVQTNCFEGRESNDREYGYEDPSDEVDHHDYKDNVSRHFLLAT
ncbi:MAG: hypothetical protein Q9195_005413 [Heterodermia aff. obscurata]